MYVPYKNMAFTLNSSLDIYMYLLFANFTTYNYYNY